MISFSQDAIAAIVREVLARLERAEAEAPSAQEAVFRSPHAEGLKREICAVGKKLWRREYVDGNGGNISCRITDQWVLCTPTMCSKGDLTPEDLAMVDLDGNRICGSVPHTSEIRLHLAIYRTVPRARAVVHCHPPHATAYAITGVTPPLHLTPEFEVFVGPVPVTPYETPGTQKFADTVIPFVKEHNTILLANHGVVCWADTATHAEWCVEVLETYCRTLLLAAQIGQPLRHIPEEKIAELLAVKRRIGLPDPRHAGQPTAAATETSAEIENLVQSIAEEIAARLEKRG